MKRLTCLVRAAICRHSLPPFAHFTSIYSLTDWPTETWRRTPGLEQDRGEWRQTLEMSMDGRKENKTETGVLWTRMKHGEVCRVCRQEVDIDNL